MKHTSHCIIIRSIRHYAEDDFSFAFKWNVSHSAQINRSWISQLLFGNFSHTHRHLMWEKPVDVNFKCSFIKFKRKMRRMKQKNRFSTWHIRQYFNIQYQMSMAINNKLLSNTFTYLTLSAPMLVDADVPFCDSGIPRYFNMCVSCEWGMRNVNVIVWITS